MWPFLLMGQVHCFGTTIDGQVALFWNSNRRASCVVLNLQPMGKLRCFGTPIDGQVAAVSVMWRFLFFPPHHQPVDGFQQLNTPGDWNLLAPHLPATSSTRRWVSTAQHGRSFFETWLQQQPVDGFQQRNTVVLLPATSSTRRWVSTAQQPFIF